MLTFATFEKYYQNLIFLQKTQSLFVYWPNKILPYLVFLKGSSHHFFIFSINSLLIFIWTFSAGNGPLFSIIKHNSPDLIISKRIDTNGLLILLYCYTMVFICVLVTSICSLAALTDLTL